jgi:hypothetical protein
MGIVIYHHNRRERATADARHGIQGEEPVFGGVSHLDTQLVLQIARQTFRSAHQVAGQTLAHLQHIAASGLGTKERVKTGHCIHFARGHTQPLGDALDGLWGQTTVLFLSDVESGQ